jgi:predicted GNAT family N-acyltransferase
VLEVRRAADEDELAQALALRRAVFVDEQGVPLAAERDGRDSEAMHLVALEGGRVLGTCRLLLASSRDRRGAGVEVRLGRLAVAPEGRRRGIASALLTAAEQEARAAGAERIVLHAQTYASRLYADAGYRRRGRPFLEQGLEHVTMERRLA